MKYKTVVELLDYIERPLKNLIFNTWHENEIRFKAAKGSQRNHQAWVGGYVDHLSEVMNIARLLHKTFQEKRNLPFTLSDALVILFLHDIEKAFPERITEYEVQGSGRVSAKNNTRWDLIQKFGIFSELRVDLRDAIGYVEGEKDEYSNTHRTMSPLAAFCHLCDVTSARIWFDNPRLQGEKWGWRESDAESS